LASAKVKGKAAPVLN